MGDIVAVPQVTDKHTKFASLRICFSMRIYESSTVISGTEWTAGSRLNSGSKGSPNRGDKLLQVLITSELRYSQLQRKTQPRYFIALFFFFFQMLKNKYKKEEKNNTVHFIKSQIVSPNSGDVWKYTTIN